MRARQVFMDALLAHGVDAIFGNPGTTENPLLDSLADYPAITYYVALHEGVAVGAGAYYAMATGRPAVASLHVAPGLGNAIGMLYGALKGGAPLVVTAGQQDTRMRLRDPILRHDLVAMAAPVTKWAVEVQHGDEMATVMRRAFRIATEPPAGPVFVALPVDVMEQETAAGAEHSGDLHFMQAPDPDGVARLAEILLNARSPAFVAGDGVPADGANAALEALVAATGATVYVEALKTRLAFPTQHPANGGRLPYHASAIRALLAEHDVVFLIGGPYFEEVWFDDEPFFAPDTIVVQADRTARRLAGNFPVHAAIDGRLSDALTALTAAVEAHANEAFRDAATARRAALDAGHADARTAFEAAVTRDADVRPMPAAVALAALARALPDDIVVVDETITAFGEVPRAFDLRRAGDYYATRGGGIGQGVAGALGVAAAEPERTVVALTGDGSAMYSIQALWTAAHHGLRLVFVVLSNREYRVLKHNLDTYRQRFGVPTDRPYPHMNLTEPALGFVDLAKGMGVAGGTAASPAEIESVVSRALTTNGPSLVELIVAGRG